MTIDERIAAELRRSAPRVDERVAWDRIQSAAPSRGRRRSLSLVLAWVATGLLLVVGIGLFSSLDSDPGPAVAPPSPFVGTWVTIDGDGSTPTATIEVSTDGVVEIVVVDDRASVCSGAPSTMTGTGRFQGETELVFPTPVLTCDDGSQPVAPSGQPLEEQLRNLTFTHDPGTDTLTDNFASVWTRKGALATTAHPLVRWPQSSLEEVQESQERADAGDPNYTWQLAPNMESAAGQVDTPEILARFVQEELGWEEFALIGGSSGTAESQGIRAVGVELIRCEPGKSNPLWPDEPQFGGCAPTIDDFRYETVEIFVAQPGKRGPEGIWVVSAWSEVYPVEQVAPLTDDEIAAIVEPFLQARIAGEGAEQYLHDLRGDWRAPGFLYATSTGAPYERAEFEVTDGPHWPQGWVGLKVRLFANGGQTVVEQTFSLGERDGLWALVHGPGAQSTENGQPLPKP